MQKCWTTFYNSVQMSSEELLMTSSSCAWETQATKKITKASRLYMHITWGHQAFGAFCHQVTQLFSWEGMWVKACSRIFSSTAALAAMPAATHGGCTARKAFVPWLISLCFPVLLTNFPSTWQHAAECWFCQSYKYLVYKETCYWGFSDLDLALPGLYFLLQALWALLSKDRPSALPYMSLEVIVSLSLVCSLSL